MTKRGTGKPHINALVLADHVYVDRETNKFIVAGTFGRVIANAFPTVFPRSAIYLNISDFQGEHHLAVCLVRLSDGAQLARSADVSVAQADRLHHQECCINLPPIQFDEPGPYAIEVLWDGDYLGRCKIQAVLEREVSS